MFLKAFIFERSVNQMTEKYLNSSKQRILRLKAAFVARVNLVTAESLELVQKPTKKMLAYSASKETSNQRE